MRRFSRRLLICFASATTTELYNQSQSVSRLGCSMTLPVAKVWLNWYALWLASRTLLLAFAIYANYSCIIHLGGFATFAAMIPPTPILKKSAWNSTTDETVIPSSVTNLGCDSDADHHIWRENKKKRSYDNTILVFTNVSYPWIQHSRGSRWNNRSHHHQRNCCKHN